MAISLLYPSDDCSNRRTRLKGDRDIRKLTIAALSCAAASIAQAQDEPGFQLILGLESSLIADDNYALDTVSAGDSFIFQNDVSVRVRSETRLSVFDAEAGISLISADIAGSSSETGAVNPYGRISFSREAVGGQLDVSLTARQTDLSFSRLLQAPGDATFMTVDDGTSLRTGASAALTFGEGALIGGTVSASHSMTDYSGTTDPDLFDSETTTLSASGRVDVNSTLTISPSVTHVDYSADDIEGTDTETLIYSLGATVAVSEILSLTGSVSQEEISRTTTVPAATTEESATNFGLSATLLASNGSHTLSIETRTSLDGQRTELNYDRVLEFIGEEVSFGFGVTETAAGGTEFTARANFQQELPTGLFSVSLDRAVLTASDGGETVSTEASVLYSYDISEVASFELGAQFSEESSPGDEETNTSASVAYRRELTEDWDLLAGVQHRISDDSGAGRATSNSIFVTVARTWVTGL